MVWSMPECQYPVFLPNETWNRMLLKTTEFRRKLLSLFLQLCTDLENKLLYFKFRNKKFQVILYSFYVSMQSKLSFPVNIMKTVSKSGVEMIHSTTIS